MRNEALPLMKSPIIEFSRFDIIFVSGRRGEREVDLGGQTREFFTLLLYDFRKSDFNMFEGQGGYLLSVYIKAAIAVEFFHGFRKQLLSRRYMVAQDFHFSRRLF